MKRAKQAFFAIATILGLGALIGFTAFAVSMASAIETPTTTTQYATTTTVVVSTTAPPTTAAPAAPSTGSSPSTTVSSSSSSGSSPTNAVASSGSSLFPGERPNCNEQQPCVDDPEHGESLPAGQSPDGNGGATTPTTVGGE